MVIIDRFEEELVVVEVGRETYVLPRIFFPENANEGDVVNINVTIDKEETSKRLKEMQDLMNESLKNSEKN